MTDTTTTTPRAPGTSERAQRDVRAWRELASMSMAALGLDVSPRVVKRGKRPANAPIETDEPSDILGPQVSDWVLRTHLRMGDKLSMSLDDVDARAKAAKRPYAAIIVRRGSRDPRHSYVAMTLETFTKLLASQDAKAQTEAAKLRLKAATPPTRFP